MSVTSARGFVAAGVSAGIKNGGALDLALVSAPRPVPAAGVFTTSITAAPPVEISRARLVSGRARAVLVNSGCANAGTGDGGRSDALATGDAVAVALQADPEEVLLCSTGPIGPRLPVDRIREVIPGLVAGQGVSGDHAAAAARAIMTTDSHPKEAVSSVGTGVIGGMAKGAGMLRPDMATMLAILTTDLAVSAADLARALREAVDLTFNCLDVDGCQSTNDSVIALASGASGYAPGEDELLEGLLDVCGRLARQRAADAEGATKVIDVCVNGAVSEADARRLALAVADSGLVRSSFYGADPNWGRVLAALGVAGAPFRPTAVSISYEGVEVCRGGMGVPVDEDALSSLLKGDFRLEISVGQGPGSAQIVTTDLTPEYVRFNGDRS